MSFFAALTSPSDLEARNSGCPIGKRFCTSGNDDNRRREFDCHRPNTAVDNERRAGHFALPGTRIPGTPVMWHPAGAPVRSWRELVLARLVDDLGNRVHGWRAALDADPKLTALSAAVCNRVRTLVAACPERRDLIHGDLLHGNVLVSPDYRRVQAVISWKCSLRGDFLYDAAWCSVWGPVCSPCAPRPVAQSRMA